MIDRDHLLRTTDLAALLTQLSDQPPARLGPSTRWHCIAPDHPDHHPSVTIHTDRHGIPRWRCWSGGHGGTAIDALTTAHGWTIGEAIRHLANLDHTQLPSPARTEERVVGERILAPAVVAYAETCARLLWTPIGRPILDYLTNRGLHPDTLHLNRVGADPGPHHLPRPPGLPNHGPAAVLPALDPHGNLTYLQARYLHPHPNQPRYHNPPTRLATNPKLAYITPAHPHPDTPHVVTEGIIDALTAATHGHTATALLTATTHTPNLAHRIRHHAQHRPILLALDPDPPGHTATQRLLHHLHPHPTTTLQLPHHTDLNQHLQHRPADRSPAPDHVPSRGDLTR